MSQSFLKQDAFEALAAQSRSVHGSRYVLPVAAWILVSERSNVAAGEVVLGLAGRVERVRAIDALGKLAEIGALAELPRPDQANAPRSFNRVANPYWTYVSECLAAANAGGGGDQGDEEIWGGG